MPESVPEVDVSPVGSTPMPSVYVPLSPPYPADVPQQATEGQPFIPKWLAGVAGTVSVLLVGLAPSLPAPWGGVAAVLAMLAGLLAGAPLEVPRFAEGRPLVGASLVPLLASLGFTVSEVASGLPDGALKHCALFAAVLLCVLAGKALPLAKR